MHFPREIDTPATSTTSKKMKALWACVNYSCTEQEKPQIDITWLCDSPNLGEVFWGGTENKRPKSKEISPSRAVGKWDVKNCLLNEQKIRFEFCAFHSRQSEKAFYMPPCSLRHESVCWVLRCNK